MPIRFIHILAVALLISACGSSSGVDTKKPLNEISADESEKLCEYMAGVMSELGTDSSIQRSLCSEKGFMFELAGLGKCESVRDECMRDDMVIGFDDGFGEICDGVGFEIPVHCDVTVGEFESCIRAMRDSLRDLLSGHTCSSMRSGELGDFVLGEDEDEDEDAPRFDLLPECASLTARCELFD